MEAIGQSMAQTIQSTGGEKDASLQGVNNSTNPILGAAAGGRSESTDHVRNNMVKAGINRNTDQARFTKGGLAAMAIQNSRNQRELENSRANVETNPMMGRIDTYSGFSNAGASAGGQPVGNARTTGARPKVDSSRDKWATYAAYAVMLGLAGTCLYFYFEGSLTIDARTPLGNNPIGSVPKAVPPPSIPIPQ